MTKPIVVKDWKEAAKIVTGLDDEQFDKLYDELKEMKERRPRLPKKIQLCCPDMNLAIEESFVRVITNFPYIVHRGADWDFDFCPFCGKELVLIQSSDTTTITEDK